MNDDQRCAAQGLFLSAAVYLFGCIFLAVMTQHVFAAKVAVASAGFAALAYCAHLYATPYRETGSALETWAILAGAFAWLFGVLAGVGLLTGVLA